MTERYVQLTEDLQYARRDAAAWRQRHTQAESRLFDMQFSYRPPGVRQWSSNVLWKDCRKPITNLL
jgi:hypothetical protein